MSQSTTARSALAFIDRMQQIPELGSIVGERYLSFRLERNIDALIPLADLQGVIEIALADILPVPQMQESFLGIINWRGKATWILDLANLVGATHWCRRQPILNSGMGMLIQVRQETVSLLVEKIGTIEIYEPQDCLPVSSAMFSRELQPWLKGYFLDTNKNPRVVLDLEQLAAVL